MGGRFKLYKLSDTNSQKILTFNSYLLILLAVSIPLSIAVPNLIAVLILVNWLLLNNFKNDYEQLKKNRFIQAILLFILLHFLALLWSDNIQIGLSYTIEKESRLLLIPIFMLFIKKEHITYYISGFLFGISIAELSSYAIYFHLIEPFKYATQYDPTPFLGHVNYNPMLAIAIYILLYFTFLSQEISFKKKLLSTLFIFTMSTNMFITGGRAGQVVFFVIIIIFIIQFFKKSLIKSAILILLLLPTLFTLIYLNSNLFESRVNLAYTELTHFKENRLAPADTVGSVGLRLNFSLNSIEIIKKHLFFGVGTGGFRSHYLTQNEKNSPNITATINPHNMYIFELVEVGIIGLLSLLSLFYFQIKSALVAKEQLISYLGITLPIVYLVIMLSESYLLIPNTTYLFVLLSAFLYKKYDTKQRSI